MLTWHGENECRIGDTAFRTGIFPFAVPEDAFLLLKTREMIELYAGIIASLQPRNIFELGVYQGGSTALLSLLAEPHKLVAVDLERHTHKLTTWLRARGLENRVRIHHGIDQSDRTTLQHLVATEFDEASLDLIVDDASHRLAPTRASFEALFPYLRPGGLYIIEDWAGGHLFEKHVRANTSRLARVEQVARETGATIETPLTLLIFQSVLAVAYTGVIRDITVQRDCVIVQRGDEEVPREGFSIADCYLDSGKALLNEL